jgi:hypothetical protein
MTFKKTTQCVKCDIEFDVKSLAKKRAGGKINECPDCAYESAVKYAGLQSADGKQSQATILRFKSESDRRKYLSFWRNNSGMNKGKACQLGSHLSTTPAISFESVNTFIPTNHKGKA